MREHLCTAAIYTNLVNHIHYLEFLHIVSMSILEIKDKFKEKGTM